MGSAKRRKPLKLLSGRERVLAWLLVGEFGALFIAFALIVGGAFGVGGSNGGRIWTGLFAMCFVTFFLYGAARRRSRRFLVERDFRVCIYCGYDLRGVALPAPCPECGEHAADACGLRRHWEQQQMYAPEETVGGSI